MPAPGAVLSYSTPRVLFDRPYRHRSSNQVAGAAVLLLAAGFVVFMAGKLPSAPLPLPFHVSRIVIWMLGAGCVYGFAWLCFKWFRNDADNARITEEGVEVKQRVYPWDTIATVYGANVAGGIMIQFEVRNSGKSKWWMRTVPARALMTTPFLSPREFENLMDDLCRHVAPLHPHVKLDRVPRTSG